VTDPEDLILLFSNGVDDDGNGYVDDICGYDFFEFDNDPFDEVQYGHGTGEAEDSSAEATTAANLGACPNCMVMPVRVGDSLSGRRDSFAQGVVFSVDSGSRRSSRRRSAPTTSRPLRAAGDRLRLRARPARHGVGPQDEDSWHHIFPRPLRPHHPW